MTVVFILTNKLSRNYRGVDPIKAPAFLPWTVLIWIIRLEFSREYP